MDGLSATATVLNREGSREHAHVPARIGARSADRRAPGRVSRTLQVSASLLGNVAQNSLFSVVDRVGLLEQLQTIPIFVTGADDPRKVR